MIKQITAAVIAAIAVSSQAGAKNIDPIPEITKPTAQTVPATSQEKSSIFGNASKSGNSGSSAVFSTSNARQANDNTINFVNENTTSSNGIFSKRFAQNSHTSTPEINTANASSIPASDLRATELENALKNARQELKDTQVKLRQTEETYGVLPVDATGNPVPDEVKADIPAVPKSVISSGSVSGGSVSPKLVVTPGVNQVITISANQPNRIITPFKHPQILSSALEVGDGKACKEVCVKDSVVYVSTQKEYPIGLFITDKDNQQTALSVTLVPRRIPPREVTLELADSASLTAFNVNNDDAVAWETTQPFVDSVKKTMKELALGNVPQGYTLERLPRSYRLPSCEQPGLEFSFRNGQLVAGANLNYVIGKIRNVGQKNIEFHEASCGGYDIAAVAAYPYTLLRPGEETEVYIVQRNDTNKTVTEHRRSLLSEK